jgi:hypothetical protein
MIVWIFPSIIGAAVLLMGFAWIRRGQQAATHLIPSPVPERDPR